jgi:hypothetical protein
MASGFDGEQGGEDRDSPDEVLSRVDRVDDQAGVAGRSRIAFFLTQDAEAWMLFQGIHSGHPLDRGIRLADRASIRLRLNTKVARAKEPECDVIGPIRNPLEQGEPVGRRHAGSHWAPALMPRIFRQWGQQKTRLTAKNPRFTWISRCSSI